MYLVLASLIAINLLPYCIEVYIRHLSPLNFYDVARRGAFAELVDIGGYVKTHAPRRAVVAVNWPPPSSRPPDALFAPDRRIVQFLTDREVAFMRPNTPLDSFFAEVEGDWAVVYDYGQAWPGYHWPLVKS